MNLADFSAKFLINIFHNLPLDNEITLYIYKNDKIFEKLYFINLKNNQLEDTKKFPLNRFPILKSIDLSYNKLSMIKILCQRKATGVENEKQ